MSWIVDLVILAILALCVLLGYKRGLAKCAIKILSFVIALIVAFVFFRPISNWVIQNTEFDDNIKNSITHIIQDDVEEDGELKEDSNLPQSMVEHINEEIKAGVNQTKENAVNTVANEISIIAVNICVAVGLFIATKLILLIVNAIFSLITDLPILKQIDKTGGIIYGVLEATIIVFAVFAVISAISPIIENTGLIAMINKSVLGSILYNNNLLMKIIF